MRRVLLRVGPPGPAVKYVIGGVMHEPGVDLGAPESDIADRERVDGEGRLGLFFGDIHPIVRCRVEHDFRIDLGEMLFYPPAVCDVQLSAVRAEHFVAAPAQFRGQLHAELPQVAEDHRPFGHKTLRYHARAEMREPIRREGASKIAKKGLAGLKPRG